jgi:hypothetical protein
METDVILNKLQERDREVYRSAAEFFWALGECLKGGKLEELGLTEKQRQVANLALRACMLDYMGPSEDESILLLTAASKDIAQPLTEGRLFLFWSVDGNNPIGFSIGGLAEGENISPIGLLLWPAAAADDPERVKEWRGVRITVLEEEYYVYGCTQASVCQQ